MDHDNTLTMEQSLIRNIHKGCLAKAEASLKSQILNNELAIKVIIATCKPCIDKAETNDQIPVESLKNILLLSSQSIQELPDQFTLSFSKAMCHLMSFFISKDQFKCIIELESLWLTSTLTLENETVRIIYRNTCALINNKIREWTNTKIPDDCNFGEIVNLCAKMWVRIDSSNSVLKQKVYLFFALQYFATMQPDAQTRLYTNFLRFFQSNVTDATDLYADLMDVFRLMLQNIGRQNPAAAELFINFLSEALAILSSLPMRKEQTLYFKAITTMHNFLENFHNSNELTYPLKTLLKCLNTNVRTTDAYSTCRVMYTTCFYFFNMSKNNSSEKWAALHSKNLLLLSEIFHVLANAVAKKKTKCRYCSKCAMEMDLSLSQQVHLLFAQLVKEAIDHKVEISTHVHKTTLKHVQMCCNHIVIVSNAKCPSWEMLWTEVGPHIYNIGGKLFNMKCAHSVDYFLVLVQCAAALERLHPTIIKQDLIHNCFQCLTLRYSATQQSLKALLFATVNLLYFPAQAHKSVLWVKVKANIGENDDQRYLPSLTTVCVLEKCAQDVATLLPHVQVDEEAKVNLLLLELRQYKAIWPSKIPMLNAYRKLCAIADLTALVKGTVEIFATPIAVSNEVPKLVEDTLTKFTLNADKMAISAAEKKIYFAQLNLIHYRFQLSLLQQKNCEEMSRTITPLKPAVSVAQGAEEEVNVNDECDVVAAYASLKLDRFLNAITLLDRSVQMLDECISHADNLAILRHTNSMETIKSIAHEYQLNCFRIKALQAWHMGWKLSKLLGDSAQSLDCIGNILKLSETNTNQTDLLSESERLVAECMDQEVLTNFYVNKSLFLFDREQIEAGYTLWKRAQMCFDALDEKCKLETLKARVDFAHLKYLMLPCDFRIEGHESNFALKFHQIANDFIEFFKSGQRSSHDLLTLFEIIEHISSTYRWQHSPREVRCYTRDILTLAQRLVVPLRTCTFLIHLAIADLESLRIDDCQVKLEGLADILCLNNAKSASMKMLATFEDVPNVETNMVEVLTDCFDEIMLDCPSTVPNLTGSPVLQVKKFKMPAFVYHSTQCTCYYCVDCAYQSLVITKMTLEAELNLYKSNNLIAYDYYKGGLQLYALLKAKKCSTKQTIRNLYGVDAFNDWEDLLCDSYAFLMFRFCNYLLKTKNYKRAESISSKLRQLLPKIRWENMYFYNEILFQEILTAELQSQGKTQEKYLLTPEASAMECENLVKTPENKKSRILFTKTCSPHLSPIKKPIRVIKFDLNDKGKETVDREVKVGGALDAKTPAPRLRIPAITVSTVKIEKKKKDATVLAETTCRNQGQDCVPQSPNAYTPNALSVQGSALRTRSRLLTAKLKKSAIDKENSGENGPVPSARKNLMPALKDNETITVISGKNTKAKKPVGTKNVNVRNLRSSKK